MPKDPSKQGHRGIGFVTYASPESGAHGQRAALLLPSCSARAQRRAGCALLRAPPLPAGTTHAPLTGQPPRCACLPAVELVMGQPHVLNGNEVAIDRATPKEKAALLPGRLRCARA